VSALIALKSKQLFDPIFAVQIVSRVYPVLHEFGSITHESKIGVVQD